MNPLYAAIAVTVLLLLRAAVLAAESALAATSTDALKERGVSAAVLEAFARLKSGSELTFAALRGVQVVLIALAAALGAAAGEVWLGPAMGQRLSADPGMLAGPLVGGLGVAILAVLLDLMARAMVGASPTAVAAWCSKPALWLSTAVRVPLYLVAPVVDLAVRPLGAKARFGPPRPPLEELERLLLEEAGSQGLDPQGPKLIRNIFEMSEKTARDVMVPRTEIVCLDIATPPADILRGLAEHGHSRIPVFRERIDNVVGILHARDLVPMLQHPELIVVQDIVRPAHFIPWSKPVGEILREMQKKKIHMALVVDEYGGLLGVVTLEDVLEVIVGEIRDEYDHDLPEIEPLSDGSFLVRASIPLESFNRSFAVEVPDGEYETLGGFLNYLAGCIPETGDKFFFAGLELSVQDRSLRQVRRVRVQTAAAAFPDQHKRREVSTPSG
jgi:CBS domain containing-hemolysin-like protein